MHTLNYMPTGFQDNDLDDAKVALCSSGLGCIDLGSFAHILQLPLVGV